MQHKEDTDSSGGRRLLIWNAQIAQMAKTGTLNLRIWERIAKKNKGLFCSTLLMYETLQAVWQDMSHSGWSQTKQACQMAVFECWRKIVKFASRKKRNNQGWLRWQLICSVLILSFLGIFQPVNPALIHHLIVRDYYFCRYCRCCSWQEGTSRHLSEFSSLNRFDSSSCGLAPLTF